MNSTPEKAMKTLRLSHVHLIRLTVCLALLATLAQAENCTTDDGEFQVVGEPCLVRFFNGDLSVRVKAFSLRALLEEIARQGGFRLVVYTTLDERVNLEFRKLPLDQGLRRILRDRSYLLEYAWQSSNTPLAAARTLWILPQKEQEDSVPRAIIEQPVAGSSSEHWAMEFARLQAILTNGQSSDREEAVLELGDSGSADAVPILSLALRDENEDVRAAAVSALLDIGGDEAAHAVSIALIDTDPRVRTEAVDALGEIGGKLAMDVLQQAMEDGDEYVREAAAAILDR